MISPVILFTLPVAFTVVEARWINSYIQRTVYDIWSNNEWKPNALVLNYPSKACSMMKLNRGEAFAKVFKQDASGGCLIPRGTYYVANQDPRMALFPKMPYGKYRCLFTNGLPWRKGCMACAYVEMDLIPK
ncbi:uncharacterized protein LOC127750490 isoform X2 [Frankliniella occidentalis]|uniref:Uncharacterized protein LOC127750490 isoform X2 n=1 Tax=Frankliniella occidentalis TaxID=133901 RepID=A0A9C6XR49_FRAOC|nr:uncharacterized protein LOC127750490 isoform X2 [Frankliniella occidentalis]XP_052128247.1 uncharacterized protein LOC127750490 isoform X2 [Frankliniella occidentalis]